MGTTTTNYSWYKPAEHEGATGPSYHIPFNANWDDLDTRFKALLDGRNADAAAIQVLQTYPVNAKAYLKGDGTTESLTDRDDFVAAANSAGACYIPKGNFIMPDGEGLFESLASGITIEGAGRRQTIISTKNAYAIQTPTTGSVDSNVIRNLGTVLRAGSTSGGGIKAVSDSYHSGWEVTCIESQGQATCLEPLIHVDGWIGSYLDLIMVSNTGGDGISIARAGFPSNAWGLSRFRTAVCGLAGTTYAGVRISGVLGHVGPGIIESNRCYGAYLTAGDITVEGIHFEDQWNTNLVGNISTSTLERLRFHFLDASHVVGAGHLELINTVGPGQREFNRLNSLTFADGIVGGYNIKIGTNVEDTSIIAPRGAAFAGAGGIIDNGTRTVSYQTDGDTIWKPPASAANRLTVKGADQTGDNGSVFESGVFAVSDSVGDEVVGVTKTGHLTQRTPNGDPGTGKLQPDGFTLYWDEAAQKIKARIRNHSGADVVQTLSN